VLIDVFVDQYSFGSKNASRCVVASGDEQKTGCVFFVISRYNARQKALDLDPRNSTYIRGLLERLDDNAVSRVRE
jgi:hypothetical protein